MFLLLTRDENVVLVFALLFGAVAERRYAVAVLFVRKPLAFVPKTKEYRGTRERGNDL